MPTRMILLAVAALTIFQPGFWFAPMMRKNKQRREWDNLHAGAEPLNQAGAGGGSTSSLPSSYWPMGNQSADPRYDPVPSQPYQPYGGASPMVAPTSGPRY